MTNLSRNIADNLSLALAKTGQSQAKLASSTGIDKSKISRVIAGEATLSSIELFLIADHFKVDTQWFGESRLEELVPA